jgi:hypothetical protein
MTSTTSLRCLGRPSIEWDGASRPRLVEPDTQPMELLLRVAAAGPGGASATMLCAAMWPHVAPEARRKAMRAALRRLDRNLALRDALILDGNRVTVNGEALGVDCLELETAIAPLLNPFAIADERERARAREALAGPAARHATEFLPDIRDPWAVQARLRIADGVQRARRMLQVEMLETHE